jgi:hypothetical protein
VSLPSGGYEALPQRIKTSRAWSVCPAILDAKAVPSFVDGHEDIIVGYLDTEVLISALENSDAFSWVQIRRYQFGDHLFWTSGPGYIICSQGSVTIRPENGWRKELLPERHFKCLLNVTGRPENDPPPNRCSRTFQFILSSVTFGGLSTEILRDQKYLETRNQISCMSNHHESSIPFRNPLNLEKHLFFHLSSIRTLNQTFFF